MYFPRIINTLSTVMFKKLPDLVTSRCFMLSTPLFDKKFIRKSLELNNSSLRQYTSVCCTTQGETACYAEVSTMKVDRCYMLIDVREEEEVRKMGKIPHAINIPLSKLIEALKTLSEEDFKKKYNIEKPTPKGKIIFYSNTQKRAEIAMSEAWGLNFSNSQYYQGGWQDWLENKKREEEERKQKKK